MSKTAVATVTPLMYRSAWTKFVVKFKKNWQLHLMILLPLIYMILFHYLPMYGVQIAFREYNPRRGIWESEWVGLKHLQSFFGYYKWVDIVWNTLAISLYSVCVGFPIPVFLALFIHVNENKVLKKLAQNVSYIPHFISTVVMVGIINQIFNPVSGMYGAICRQLGIVSYEDLRNNEDAFRHLFVWSGVWQNMGWNTIIYVSALSAVPQELHEAAKIDGASRWRRVLSVDLPTILPTVAIMLIMRFGTIMSVGYEKVLLMQNALNLDKSEVISTYVYKQGLGGQGKGLSSLSFSSAVGLMNSVINTIMVVLVNWISNRLSDNEVGLF